MLTQSNDVLLYLRKYRERSGFPGGSDCKVSACNARDPGSIPGLGKSPGKGGSPGRNAGVGFHFLLQGGRPHPRIETVPLTSLALSGRFFTTSARTQTIKEIFLLNI